MNPLSLWEWAAEGRERVSGTIRPANFRLSSGLRPFSPGGRKKTHGWRSGAFPWAATARRAEKLGQLGSSSLFVAQPFRARTSVWVKPS